MSAHDLDAVSLFEITADSRFRDIRLATHGACDLTLELPWHHHDDPRVLLAAVGQIRYRDNCANKDQRREHMKLRRCQPDSRVPSEWVGCVIVWTGRRSHECSPRSLSPFVEKLYARSKQPDSDIQYDETTTLSLYRRLQRVVRRTTFRLLSEIGHCSDDVRFKPMPKVLTAVIRCPRATGCQSMGKHLLPARWRHELVETDRPPMRPAS